jgi:type VI secretion system secreted protein Hcp
MAAVDYFLKLDGIKGESKDSKHKDEIHIESFSWSLAQQGGSGTGGGGGVGKVSVKDISVTKAVDASTPALILHCANGKHIKEGLLTARKAGENPVEYLKIKLTDILISSVQEAGEGSTQPLESLSLNFAKFHVAYQEQGSDGKAAGSPMEMGWDIKANTKM